MKKTKIICTIGPASEKKETLEKMIREGGMNVMRMNFSHGDYDEQSFRINNIKELNRENNWHIGMLLDTRGPEIRVGYLENNEPVLLKQGDLVRVTMDANYIGNKGKFAISYSGLYDDIHIGGKILIEDGNLILHVVEKDPKARELVCEVENERLLKNRRNCNIPGVILNMPYISAKDKADIEFACDQNLDFIAASFVRRAQDILDIRTILEHKNNKHIKIISKIENQEGVSNMEEIIRLSDGVMVARGDLGVDVNPWDLPEIQKKMIGIAQSNGKIIVTATQMLESMQQNPRPTRAEVSDVHNAVLEGTCATMLSGETAQGHYPLEAVTYMSRIAETAEFYINTDAMIKNYIDNMKNATDENAVGFAVASLCSKFDIKAIAAEGDVDFAMSLSTYRPNADIFYAVDNDDDCRTLSVFWGVQGVVGTVNDSIEAAKKYCSLNKGDKIIEVTTSVIELITL